MVLTLQQRISLMVRLGEYLSSYDPALAAVKQEASQKNRWFIPEFVEKAVLEICEQYLQPEKLSQWIAEYPRLQQSSSLKKVGIVMAGNIPAVGFHDLLCGIISGHKLTLKLSSKDETILQHCLDKIWEWEPSLKESVCRAELLKGCDAYIATGNNNSARYFQYYFDSYPHIIRHNRTAVAVLNGTESREELEKLCDDALLYFGLGCRNVTKLYVPESYDFIPLLQTFKRYDYFNDFHHYKNNYDYQLSLLLLNKEKYMTDGVVLFREEASVFSPISVLHYQKYEDEQALLSSLELDESIQCIVSQRHIPFGSAQKPVLTDYADGVDTLEFLYGL